MSVNGIPSRNRTKLFEKNIMPKANYNDIISGKYLTYFAELDFQNHFAKSVCEILGKQFNPKNNGGLIIALIDKLPDITDRTILKNAPTLQKRLRDKDENNIGNWVRGDCFPSQSSRGTVYRLCLGLFTNGDSIERTKEFFLKACMIPPFNPKSLDDVVFYYCIKCRKDINDAYRLIKDTIPNSVTIKQRSSSETVGLSAEMEKISDENMLIEYIQNHCCIDDDLKYSLASKEIVRLTDKLTDNKIRVGFSGTFNGKLTIDKNNKRGQFEYSFSDSIETMLKKKFEFEKSEIECVKAALDDIIDTFPVYKKASTLEKLGGDKYELMRKTLMVRWIICYFLDPKKSEDPQVIYNDCRAGLDNVLYKCGLMQTYALNPFDFLMLLCASKSAYCCSENKEYTNPLLEITNHLFFSKINYRDDGC